MGKKLRKVADGRISFYCPGCKESHVVPILGQGAWSFNGSFEQPTLQPSLLISSGCKAKNWKPGEGCWCTYNAEAAANGEPPTQFKCGICHSHVKDGKIEFCSDCTHELAGKILPMQDVE